MFPNLNIPESFTAASSEANDLSRECYSSSSRPGKLKRVDLYAQIVVSFTLFRFGVGRQWRIKGSLAQQVAGPTWPVQTFSRSTFCSGCAWMRCNALWLLEWVQIGFAEGYRHLAADHKPRVAQRHPVCSSIERYIGSRCSTPPSTPQAEIPNLGHAYTLNRFIGWLWSQKRIQ